MVDTRLLNIKIVVKKNPTPVIYIFTKRSESWAEPGLMELSPF